MHMHVMQYGLKKAEETLAAASSLLAKLSGEKDSWRQQAANFQEALHHLPACSAVAAAFVVYAAAEPEGVRSQLLREWRSAPGIDLPTTFTVEGFLSGERELAEWHSWGLPSDQVHPPCRFRMRLLYRLSPTPQVAYALACQPVKRTWPAIA